MRICFIIVITSIVLFGCKELTSLRNEKTAFKQINIKEENSTQTVTINEYTLISTNLEKDKAEAAAIMKVKRLFPLAIQRKDSVLFNSILAEGFTFTGAGEFYNRAEYIQDRVHSKEIVFTAKYDGLILQLFDNYGILSYRNSIEHANEVGRKDTLRMNWTDLYVKESGKWKIKIVHLIEMRTH